MSDDKPNIFQQAADRRKREKAAADKRRRSNGANAAGEPPAPEDDEPKPEPEVVDMGEARKKRSKAKYTPPPDEEDPTSDYHRLRHTLQRNDNGAVYPTHANLLKIVRADPALVGLVSRDLFALRDSITRAPPEVGKSEPLAGPYPRSFGEADAITILAYCQERWARTFRLRQVQECLGAEAERGGYHPVRDWLATLEWDGRERLDFWLDEVFGAGTGAYQRAVGSMVMIAAVRRVRFPGCKYDQMVVLEGAQGILKSTAIAVLFGAAWFTDQLSEISKKDAAIDLCGKWVIELAEIERIVRADVEAVKGFLSRSTDHYRPPYGRQASDVPRQCVFIGTTNEEDYLRDVTGNRRIWPIKCPGLDGANIQWLRANRDQLWAEAAAREARGEEIYIPNNTATMATALDEQAARLIEDTWTEAVLCFVAGRAWVTTEAVLRDAVHVEIAFQDRRAQMRLANILKANGWVQRQCWNKRAKRNLKRWYCDENTFEAARREGFGDDDEVDRGR